MEPPGLAVLDSPGASAEPKEAPRVAIRQVSSLTEIMEVHKEAPSRPDPIDIEWFLPATPKAPAGTLIQLHIETRWPDDQWKMGVEYMTVIQAKVRSKEPDEKGVLVRKHEFADLAFIAQHVVVSPTWLHNEKVYPQLKEAMPPIQFSELRRRLMLTAGLNGDFFDEYQALTMPTALLGSASALLNGSAGTPPSSPQPPPTTSSPGPSTTTGGAPKSAESGSPTNSGSSA